MANIVIYTKENCPFCRLAKELLSNRHLSFEEVRIDLDEKKRDEMIQLSNQRTVPQIFINDQPIGGYDDLAALSRSGNLDSLLKT